MPSFLTDDNAPILSANPNILDLDFDPNNQFGLSPTKPKPHQPDSFSLGHSRSGPINESFDTSSTLSSHDSETSGAAPITTNGNGTRPTSMNSVSNGMAMAGSGADTDTEVVEMPKMTLPDRTVQQQAISGTDFTHDAPSSPSRKGQRPSRDKYQLLTETRPEAPTRPPPPTPSVVDQDSRTRTPPLPSAPVSTDRAPARSSPHRFSSPPAYNPTTPAAVVASSSTGHLQPPTIIPPLKQRHTLEVPKLPPGRISKDGIDTAQSSGRFSPSAATAGARRASLNLARRTTRSMQSDVPRDEIVRDEDAVRWAEAYRQKRASKRKRREEEDDDRVLVGTKVDESHANWVTAYNMLTGIRVSVSRTNAKLDRELTDADFEVKQKSTFDITGNELVPSAKYDFKFKDYAPWVFRRLRTLFRLDPADYLMSLTGKYILSELGSPGKSGSFFYFSRDYKYIIKTIHHSEHKFLRKILKDYYTHVQENPNTLLSQFYGLHRVKMPYGKKIHFVVMNNLFPPHRDIHTTFDLKGSTVGRDYREDDLAKNPRATLKDLNWLRRQQNLELGLQKKRMFLEQLQRDVILLKRLQIMDYSLLIGIHDLSRGNEENLRDKTLQVFNPGGEKSADDEPPSALLRTPSKLESVRKARELRQMIRQERPVPMGQALNKMPNELDGGHTRPGFVFNQDDGGFQATHEDNTPADVIYYLGVIDCLTHYGMIKKIEHFWKGLSKDRTQISALPPDQYGDRFYNFVEGITMSPEEARRETERKDQEAVRAQASLDKASKKDRQKSIGAIPPMPDRQPPAPPPSHRAPEARETVDMATREMRREDTNGPAEMNVPDRTMTTAEGRNSNQHEPILPVVEEGSEQGRDEMKCRSQPSPTMARPPVPTEAPPHPPSKSRGVSKPDSSDSGYGDNNTTGADGSYKLRTRSSHESLNKKLPALPKEEETQDSGIKMIS